MRLDQVVAQLGRPHPAQHVGDEQRVAQGFAHLLPGQPEQPVVHPVPGEAVAGRAGLGDLVLVVREDQVHPAAVDVEGGPRYLVAMAEHSRCQPGRPGPHGVSQDGSPGLAPFHRVKSRGSRLASRAVVGVLGGPHRVQPLPGQGSVPGVGVHVEVHVPAAGVGVAALDQPPDQHDHLRDVPGGPRLDVRRPAAERVVGPGERALVAFGHDPWRNALGPRGAQDLVLHVGDVAAEGDLVPGRLEPADQHVEDHSPNAGGRCAAAPARWRRTGTPTHWPGVIGVNSRTARAAVS